jgi:hypothetical protein
MTTPEIEITPELLLICIGRSVRQTDGLRLDWISAPSNEAGEQYGWKACIIADGRRYLAEADIGPLEVIRRALAKSEQGPQAAAPGLRKQAGGGEGERGRGGDTEARSRPRTLLIVGQEDRETPAAEMHRFDMVLVQVQTKEDPVSHLVIKSRHGPTGWRSLQDCFAAMNICTIETLVP